jgi:hypothetical protein
MMTIPSHDTDVQKATRLPYLIVPLDSNGQQTLAMSDGKTLKKAIMPLGISAGTRSSAAERMMT